MRDDYKVNQLFFVPNDQEGAYFLHLCKKYIGKSYGLKVRGRTPDHDKLKKAKTTAGRGGTPIKYAKNLGVYLTDTDGRTVGIRLVEEVEAYREKAYLNHAKEAKAAMVERMVRDFTTNINQAMGG